MHNYELAYKKYVEGYDSHAYQKVGDNNKINVRYATITGGMLERGTQVNCFSNLYTSFNEPKEYEAILLQVHDKVAAKWVGTTEKEFFTYYEWLFNHSPLRDAFVHKDISRVMKDKVVVFDPNQDSRIVINAMFATRMAWEAYSHPYIIAEKIRIWNDMIDMGVEPNQAFALSVGMIKSQGFYKVCTYPNNHEFLDVAEKRHLNFLSSSLDPLGKSFNKIGGYKSVQALWDKPRDTTFNLLSFITERWNKVKKDNNPFAKPVQGTGVLDRDAFLGTLKEISTDYQSKLKELKINVAH